MRPCTLHVGTETEDSGRDRSTQTTKEEERASEGGERRQRQAAVDCGDGRRAEPFREMTTPAAECQIVLVQNRGSITNEFNRSKRWRDRGCRTQERCRPSPRHQALDWWTRRSPREQRKSTLGAPGKSGRMNNTEVPVLWDEWQGGRQDARSSLD